MVLDGEDDGVGEPSHSFWLVSAVMVCLMRLPLPASQASSSLDVASVGSSCAGPPLMELTNMDSAAL